MTLSREIKPGVATRRMAEVLIVMLISLAAGCASNPDPLEVVEVEAIEATVVAIDVPGRLVSLRGPAGNELAIQVSPEVRNLAQVNVGDTLKVSYKRALIATITEAGQASTEVPVTVGVARTPEGAMPGVVAGGMISATVEVISVGEDGATITFRGPAGELRSIDVKREKSRAFVRKLRAGDLVDLTYAEAIAVEVEQVGG